MEDDRKHFLGRDSVLLIVGWIVLKIVLKIAGFAIHLLLIAGLIFLIWSLIKRASATMRRRV